MFGADGGRLGVVKGGAWNTMDENRIIKITISSFTYMKGSPVVYGAGWNQLDNADISIPADMFNSIYGPVDLEYNAKVTVNGSITSCNAEVYFYSLVIRIIRAVLMIFARCKTKTAVKSQIRNCVATMVFILANRRGERQ